MARRERLLTEADVRTISVRAARTAIEQAIEDGWLSPSQVLALRAEAWDEGYAARSSEYALSPGEKNPYRVAPSEEG